MSSLPEERDPFDEFDDLQRWLVCDRRARATAVPSLPAEAMRLIQFYCERRRFVRPAGASAVVRECPPEVDMWVPPPPAH